MTKKLIYFYTEEDVFEALRERILTKEVREHLGSEEEFRLVAHTFSELTYSEEMVVFGKIYYQNDVRRIICDELDSSTVIDAYDIYKSQYLSKGAKLLAWLILREHLSQEEIATLMFEYDFGGGE